MDLGGDKEGFLIQGGNIGGWGAVGVQLGLRTIVGTYCFSEAPTIASQEWLVMWLSLGQSQLAQPT